MPATRLRKRMMPKADDGFGKDHPQTVTLRFAECDELIDQPVTRLAADRLARLHEAEIGPVKDLRPRLHVRGGSAGVP
jgi:hypothetical protein